MVELATLQEDARGEGYGVDPVFASPEKQRVFWTCGADESDNRAWVVNFERWGVPDDRIKEDSSFDLVRVKRVHEHPARRGCGP
jgi:hypothetical protein